MVKKQLLDLEQTALQEIMNCKSVKELNDLQVKYLWKKSELTNILRQMKDIPHEERLVVGKLANEIKVNISQKLEEQIAKVRKLEFQQQVEMEKIDVSLPVYDLPSTNLHPLNLIIEEVSQVFTNLGYDIVYGQEVEDDEYNFQRLNMPVGHPARDMQDTFYINENTLIRTHCTNVTARRISNMQSDDEVLAIISAGNVYRRDDDDATHSHQFMQIDALLIAPNVSFANLKWTLQYFCERMFGENTKIRLRPSFFPFTEPSVEVDVTCIKCTSGCSLCKYTGWIEILGAGMVNPLVYRDCGKSEKLTGFAFGIGIERIAMLKYGIDDIRHFYTNDVRFLQQFKNFN